MGRKAALFRKARIFKRLDLMNTLWKTKGAWLLLALVWVASLSGSWEKGDALPVLAGFELEGELPDFAGQVTYIDFWASWCAPCKASFPEMERIYQDHQSKGFQVLAVSVDSSEKAMRRFLDRAAPSFTVVRDASQALVSDAGIEAMPTSFLVDRQGIIRAVHYGWRGEETVRKLESEIAELLAEDRE